MRYATNKLSSASNKVVSSADHQSSAIGDVGGSCDFEPWVICERSIIFGGMKVTVEDQIARLGRRIAAYQWFLDHPRIDGRCCFCGTFAASCTCISNTKRDLVYAEKRLAVLRAETTLTPKEVEGLFEESRLIVKRRERDEKVGRLESAYYGGDRTHRKDG